METDLDLVVGDGRFWVATTIESQDHLDRSRSGRASRRIERVMVGGIWVVTDWAAAGARPGLVLCVRAISQRRTPRRSRRAVDRPRAVTR